jgi:hypothetical protein
MKKSVIFAVLMLSALVYAGAQQPNGMPSQSGAQATSPNPSQSPSTMPGAAQQNTPDATPQAGTSAPAAGGAITEGCLGGSNPNFTLTDSKGTAYKLVLPAGADGSKLTPHVGESIQVLGDVSSSSITVSKVGKGNGTCPGK